MSVLTESTDPTALVEAPAVEPCAAEFGTRRGRLQHHIFSLALRCGAFRRERRIDWSRVQQFIFVCRGNICRSPYAARRARVAGLRAFSCGLHIGDNVAIDPMAAMIARSRGLDLHQHVPRDIQQIRVNTGDLLVAMEPAHLQPLRKIIRNAGAQATLLGLWSTPRRPCLTDPYGLCEAYFNRCFMLIDSGIAGLAAAYTEARRVA
ncbi:MAG TPA: hypothetical protein P5572_13645 [Phycisphaerae bacterium]|nr:hypothetical protein [Phycisphaerales bacterium]HRX86058.1 hypothetical protein [Phycisphaerae bacterium]